MVKKIKLGGKHCIMVDVNVTRHKCRVPLEADELVLLQFKEGPLLEIQSFRIYEKNLAKNQLFM